GTAAQENTGEGAGRQAAQRTFERLRNRSEKDEGGIHLFQHSGPGSFTLLQDLPKLRPANKGGFFAISATEKIGCSYHFAHIKVTWARVS
ncbi:MAG: hypothetical protein WCP72_10185, partial [Desulfomonile sp.]